MHQIVFVGSDDEVDELELDESPVDSFPCMSTQQFHREARAQLYSLVTGMFLDDAAQLEEVFRPLTDDGPYIYKLNPDLQEKMSRLEDDDIGELAEQWLLCEDLETLDLEVSDLHEFMYQFVHFCYTAERGDELAVFIYSDG
ncbi:MAG: hypothetical protein WD002_03395 [Pseudomonadales bacterium]